MPREIGDRVIAEDGREIEFPRKRKECPPRVVTLRDALVVAGLCTTIFSGIAVFSLRAVVREEIGYHNNDARAHPAAMEPIHNHIARQEAEAAASRDLLERVVRIESKVTNSSESIARIEERLNPTGASLVPRRK